MMMGDHHTRRTLMMRVEEMSRLRGVRNHEIISHKIILIRKSPDLV